MKYVTSGAICHIRSGHSWNYKWFQSLLGLASVANALSGERRRRRGLYTYTGQYRDTLVYTKVGLYSVYTVHTRYYLVPDLDVEVTGDGAGIGKDVPPRDVLPHLALPLARLVRRGALNLDGALVLLVVADDEDLGPNSIALLKSQHTFQQSFQQSFQYYRVSNTTIKTLLKTLLKSLLIFQQSY